MSTFSRSFLFPTMTSNVSAGSEAQSKRKRSFDDLILPSLNFDTKTLAYQESPYFFQHSVAPQFDRRASTAPASPMGFTTITPNSSPILAKAPLANGKVPTLPPITSFSNHASSSQTQQYASVPHSSATNSSSSSGFISTALNLAANNTTRDHSDDESSDSARNRTEDQHCRSLPMLKNLQLLPNPNIQEYAYCYPDTSERTPLWRENLVRWCKNENYNEYLRISREVKNIPRVSLPFSGLNILANVATVTPVVPSILNPKDQFYELSNAPNNGVVTPPMSPGESAASTQLTPQFTPFVSEKLVQTIKRKRASSHKKTNSFKAREMKKLLDNRDVLCMNSKGKVNKPTKRRSSIAQTPQQFVMKISTFSPGNTTPRSPSPVRTTSPSRSHTFIVNEPRTPITKSNIAAGSPGSGEFIRQDNTAKKVTSPRRSSARTCISCHSSDSPCWRPSWTDKKQDQLCNSCGLRYKKTHTRCLNDSCRKIPSKGELAMMKANGVIRQTLDDGTIIEGLGCLFCNSIVETRD
ncbi:LAFE_0E08592g1_1 [Lachancea fermentati]|uniref:LAFE_0E08592g1_1 n=1 Tax=Lachancea fermentati TaxID=4955 RepID=A0A1G4MDQ0_LACFM|nr:LAFE_0E08592g1_1 [Lachancea fermentati]